MGFLKRQASCTLINQSLQKYSWDLTKYKTVSSTNSLLPSAKDGVICSPFSGPSNIGCSRVFTLGLYFPSGLIKPQTIYFPGSRSLLLSPHLHVPWLLQIQDGVHPLLTSPRCLLTHLFSSHISLFLYQSVTWMLPYLLDFICPAWFNSVFTRIMSCGCPTLKRIKGK